MNIVVLGTGYVGLVSGVCLASKGHDVTCIDLREEIISGLNSGVPHIHEIGLTSLLKNVLDRGNFRAATRLVEAIDKSELVLVAVGTPSVNGHIDLTFIREAARQLGVILRSRNRFLAIVVKSTVIPGTTDTVVKKILEEQSGKSIGEFGLGMNPEFLREGNAIEDFMNPDRIVLGSEDKQTRRSLEELYAPWNVEKLLVNTRTAEFIKYANNCLLAVQISAANELANLAASLGGLDINDVMNGVYLDRRWSPLQPDGSRVTPQILTYLSPGCGFGGSCFPKDVQALTTQGKDRGIPMDILSGVLKVNAAQPAQIARLLQGHFGSLSGRQILVLGLAFKPDTDDIRESPSERILQGLLDARAQVIAHDPIALENAKATWKHLQEVEYTTDWMQAIDTVEAVVVVTKWKEYKQLSSQGIIEKLKGKVILDARRFFSPEDFSGSYYMAIGRTPEKAADRAGP